MKILYFTQSILPSLKANSIHVEAMFKEFIDQNIDIHLYCYKGKFSPKLTDSLNYKNTTRFLFFEHKFWLIIGAFYFSIHSLFFKNENIVVYTRCLYSAFFQVLFRRKVIYEMHNWNKNKFLIKILDYLLNSHKFIYLITITNSLKTECINHYINKFPLLEKKIIVLPDGANIEGYESLGDLQYLNNLIVYTGSFQKGKGLEIVNELALSLKNHTFLAVGGTYQEFYSMGFNSCPSNLHIIPKISAHSVRLFQKIAHVNILPNQKNVFVNNSKTDIGQYTSPIKMFEYMACKRPFIASDLPVLKEVLIDNFNCLLSEFDNVNSWIENIIKIQNDDELSNTLIKNAFSDVKNKYTWKARAIMVIELAKIKL